VNAMDRVYTFDTRAEASAYAAGALSTALAQGTLEHGTASFMGSGGSSPSQVYAHLSRTRLKWSNIKVGLVDERWVAPNDLASNERLLREHLLVGQAASAQFLPMKSENALPLDGAKKANDSYQRGAPTPYTGVLLGMGPDGHTASWFPNADGLTEALDADGTAHVLAIDATGAPVAGDHPHRLTLTLAALKSTRTAILLCFGEEKRGVLENALKGKTPDLPVSYAIEALGDRLSILWAP